MGSLFHTGPLHQIHIQSNSEFGVIEAIASTNMNQGDIVMYLPTGDIALYDGTSDPIGILLVDAIVGEITRVRHIGEVYIGITLQIGKKYYADANTHRISLLPTAGPCLGFAVAPNTFYTHRDYITGGTTDVDMDTLPVVPPVKDKYDVHPLVSAEGDRVMVGNTVYQVDSGVWVAKSHQDGQVVYLVDKKQEYVRENGVWEPIYNLSLYEEKASKGQVDGYAPLDSDGKVPATHLPTIPSITGLEEKINKGIADGYAPLDSDTKIPLIYLPKLDNKIKVVSTIADRDDLLPLSDDILVYVLDATADSSISSGSACYIYDAIVGTWRLISTGVSIDLESLPVIPKVDHLVPELIDRPATAIEGERYLVQETNTIYEYVNIGASWIWEAKTHVPGQLVYREDTSQIYAKTLGGEWIVVSGGSGTGGDSTEWQQVTTTAPTGTSSSSPYLVFLTLSSIGSYARRLPHLLKFVAGATGVTRTAVDFVVADSSAYEVEEDSAQVNGADSKYVVWDGDMRLVREKTFAGIGSTLGNGKVFEWSGEVFTDYIELNSFDLISIVSGGVTS